MFGLRMQVPLLAAAILLVAPVEATTTYYQGASSEGAFDTAVGSLTLLNPGLTFSGDLEPNGLLNASGTGIDFLGFDTDFVFNSPQGFTLNAGQLIGNPSEVVEIALPAAGVYAFGTHVTVTSGAETWCVDLTKTGCGSTFFNSSPSDVQFFGVVSDTPITAPLYIRYQGGNPHDRVHEL